MDETPFFSHSDELSSDDLAVIQAFDALDDLALSTSLDEQTGNTGSLLLQQGMLGVENPEDMLILFASEADEDISTMRRALQQLLQEHQISSPGLVALGRVAHKLKGTAGAMGCEAMSAIALQIEEEIHLIKGERVELFSGIKALQQATNALELTLQSVINEGQENPQPLQDFLQGLAQINAQVSLPTSSDEDLESTLHHLNSGETSETASPEAIAQIDIRSLNSLMSHTEHLIELHTPLLDAQNQVSKSLIELQAAHTRLRHLEVLLTNLAFTNTQPVESEDADTDHVSSSLVARILHEARLRTGRPQSRQRQAVRAAHPTRLSELALWDEMEMDRFTENKILLQTFNEAVADVATASAQLRSAFAQLNTLIEQQVRQATVVRNDALRLRSAPFSVLLTQVQRAIQRLAQSHNQLIQFEAAGETTEIDQDILEFLAGPLLHLIRTSVSDSLLSASHPQRNHIWLNGQAIGNEIVIELGFSMPIPGGAVEALRVPLQQLHGTIAAQGNTAGGVIYQLRFPRMQGIIQGLLVQANGQSLVLPLPQIHLIDSKRQETYTQVYHLASLLGFPPAPNSSVNTPPPVILLTGTHRRIGLQVDEITGDIELVMKPLAAHLQRPGVVGTAVDGAGNVLLILDLHALIQYDTSQRRTQPQNRPPFTGPLTQNPTPESKQSATILVADDSVYMRQFLRHTFEHASFKVIEARDGIEALEVLTSDQPPDVLMLDIEMPNLNGYDLLNILHSQPGLSDCKTILLTSRSSDKHRQRAMELGAYAFLSKPCPQEVLLETVRKTLDDLQISIQQ